MEGPDILSVLTLCVKYPSLSPVSFLLVDMSDRKALPFTIASYLGVYPVSDFSTFAGSISLGSLEEMGEEKPYLVLVSSKCGRRIFSSPIVLRIFAPLPSNNKVITFFATATVHTIEPSLSSLFFI